MRTILLLLAAAVVVPAEGRAQTPDELRADTAVASAERAAVAWLAQVDSAQWEATHSGMAPALRAATTVQGWRDVVRQMRSSLEPLGARELAAVERGHPVFGESTLTLRFGVATAADTHVTESVVLVRTADRWAIGGYRLVR